MQKLQTRYGTRFDLVLYHKNCWDGLAAAWAARQHLQDSAEYVAVTYENPPPDVKGKRVLIIDFSYPKKVMLEMAKEAEVIVVLDHHETAKKDCEGVDFAYFGNNAGCILAWKYFNGALHPPVFLSLIEDRDLWNWNYAETRPFAAGLFSDKMEFEVLDRLDELGINPTVAVGKVLLKNQSTQVEFITKNKLRYAYPGGIIGVVNSPIFQSEIGAYLLEECGCTIALVWFADSQYTIKCSLRSEGGCDVGDLATKMGGGGHKTAAGFGSKLGFDTVVTSLVYHIKKSMEDLICL